MVKTAEEIETIKVAYRDYVMGLSESERKRRSKKIILSDGTTKKYSPEEVLEELERGGEVANSIVDELIRVL